MAIPIVAGIILKYIINDRLSAHQAAQQAAAQFNYFQRLNDAQLKDTAIYLGQNTDLPYWDWFRILENLRDYGMIRTDAAPPPAVLPPPKPAIPVWFWIAMAASVAVIIIGGSRK